MKGNMKKKLIIGSLALSLFGTGALTGGAASTWVNQLVADGNRKINAAADAKKKELLADIESKIQEKMMQGMDDEIAEREAEAQRLLEEHFNQKVSELDSSQDIAEVERQWDVNLENTVGRMKEDINKAFGTVY